MRTPGHDFELAAGYLAHEGLLPMAGVRTVAYCTDAELTPEQRFNVVTVTLAAPPPTDPGDRHGGHGAGSACGVCGEDSIEAVLDVARAPNGPARSRPSVVRGLPDALRAAQTVFARTGGVHAAALTDAEGTLLVVREDIGRHNAVDKVTGARVLGGQPTAVPCVVVSGRAGFELVQKAVAAGIGTLVAVGAPSSLAVSLARASGIGLYGFTSSGRCVRYAWRLAGHPTVLRRREARDVGGGS
ncbi:MAG: formate dehydrogenase accessory sulfurtransferase FdhD [Nocardioides sp.]